ncbi:MAG: ABC transporter ATP-binding protein [Spirochaetes bacterium]|nr:ABC transporter ATP-binding protein [Spirochaetota bacterium]
MNAIVSINGLCKAFPGNPPLDVIKDFSLNIPSGEILAVTGASGSGKTTLLNLIAGIDSITGGDITVSGKSVARMNERDLSVFRSTTIGYVFQFHNLLTEFNALENVMIPFLIRAYDRKAAKQRATEILERVGLAGRLLHLVGELSGGEQQRVAIARALVNNPALLLADEPTGNLDRTNADMVADLLWDIARERAQTLIIVTHAASIAERAHRIIDLGGRR